MGGRLGARAEVAGRPNETLAEVAGPDAVDEYARSQRVVGAGDGATRKRAGRSPPWLTIRGDHLRSLPGHGRTAIVRIAAKENDGLGGALRIVEHVGPGVAAGLEALKASTFRRRALSASRSARTVAETFRVGLECRSARPSPDLEDFRLVRGWACRRRR